MSDILKDRSGASSTVARHKTLDHKDPVVRSIPLPNGERMIVVNGKTLKEGVRAANNALKGVRSETGRIERAKRA